MRCGMRWLNTLTFSGIVKGCARFVALHSSPYSCAALQNPQSLSRNQLQRRSCEARVGGCQKNHLKARQIKRIISLAAFWQSVIIRAQATRVESQKSSKNARTLIGLRFRAESHYGDRRVRAF